MTIEYLRYTVPGERGDDFVAAYARASEPLLASPHCTGFDLARCVEDPTRFVLRIEWTSADDHLKRFRGSDEFKAFFAHVKPFVGEIDEMRHYERLLPESSGMRRSTNRSSRSGTAARAERDRAGAARERPDAGGRGTCA